MHKKIYAEKAAPQPLCPTEYQTPHKPQSSAEHILLT